MSHTHLSFHHWGFLVVSLQNQLKLILKTKIGFESLIIVLQTVYCFKFCPFQECNTPLENTSPLPVKSWIIKVFAQHSLKLRGLNFVGQPHLLWYLFFRESLRTTTFTPVAECLKVELSLPVSMTKICLIRIQTSDLPHERQMSTVPLYTVSIN